MSCTGKCYNNFYTNKSIEKSKRDMSSIYTANLTAYTINPDGSKYFNANTVAARLAKLKRIASQNPSPTNINPYNHSVVAGCNCP